jgi:hypothetical protein
MVIDDHPIGETGVTQSKLVARNRAEVRRQAHVLPIH